MSRFFKWALGALVAVSLAGALVVGCSDDDQQQQQQEQLRQQAQAQQQTNAEQQAQPQQQQEREAAASAQSAQSQQQQQQQSQPQAVSAEPVKVVVSTQIIADWVRQVGGDRVSVRALVPAGADVHLLELTVSDIRAIADADLVVINGAGLESAYEDVIRENAVNILDLAEAIEAAGHELMAFGALMGEDEHGHDDEEMHDDDHGAAEAVGRLLVADAVEARLSVIDLSTDDVDSGIFEIAAPNASVYSSPTHRYGIVLARGPEDGDDRIHIFDGGVYLVEHGDHYDLFTEPVSRHSLEIAEEAPVHTVNNLGWTAIFADGTGHVILINEHDLASATGDYEPFVFEAGPQHGSALVVSEGHIAVTVPHPDFLENPDFWNILPEGVEVRTFSNELVFDAGACHRTHGVGHNEHGAVFGCWTGTLFLHAHDGEYESELLSYPAEAGPEGEFAIGQYFSHPDSENFFGQSTLFPGGECCLQGGVWLVDVAHGEFREVFPEPSAAAAFSGHGDIFFVLAADGILRAFDAHDGDMIASAQLLDPFELVFGVPTPKMIGVGEHLFITNPADGHVLMVDVHSLEVVEEWHLGGAPSSLAFVGVTDSGGAPHAGHDDDEEDEHGHEEDEHEEEGDDHGHHHHGSEDPHFWFDADLASVAITAIADELAHLNPDDADMFGDRRDLYLAEVEAADAEARALIESVPENQRVLVTFHDAFAYFARRYGLEVVGFLIHGPEQGISAEAIAELVELIEHEGVTTVFHEPQFDSSALDAVSDETGARRGIIWSQPTVDNPTYLGILLGNARAIAEQ